MKRLFAALCGLAFLLGSLFPLRAADELRARADRVSGRIKEKDQEQVVLEGNVAITHGRTAIETERAVYDKTAGSLACTGYVRLRHEGVEIEAEELIYLRRTREGTFRGGVRLSRSEEKDEAGKVAKDPFTLTCQELVFATESKGFTARGEAAMVHAEFTATAAEIVYDDAHQELRLTGAPKLTREDETIEAEEIVIAVEEDTFTIHKARISFLVEEEEEEEGGNEGGDEGSGTGGAPSEEEAPSGS